MIAAALIVDGLFDLAGILPSGTRPGRSAVFGHVAVDYKLALNVLGLVVFASLFALTARRGTTDPECGMKVDRHAALKLRSDVGTVHFCSPTCLEAYSQRAALASSAPPDSEQDGARHYFGQRHRGAQGIAGAAAEGGADV
jgi:YHS domain-containing protein